MPTVPLQIGAPAEFNPDYSYWRQIGPKESRPTHAFLTWTVTQGEAWMFQTVTGLFSTSAAVANRNLELEIFDAAGNDIYIAVSSANMVANNSYTCSAALGVTEGGVSGVAGEDGGIHLALPWLILPAGFSLRFLIGNEDVGDNWTGTSFATVTAYRVGPSDPGAVVEQLGPFMFVPGPTPVAA